MFALCTTKESRSVSVDVRVGCNYTDFNCTQTIIHNGTGNVSLFAAPPHTPHKAQRALPFDPHALICTGSTRCRSLRHTTRW